MSDVIMSVTIISGDKRLDATGPVPVVMGVLSNFWKLVGVLNDPTQRGGYSPTPPATRLMTRVPSNLLPFNPNEPERYGDPTGER